MSACAVRCVGDQQEGGGEALFEIPRGVENAWCTKLARLLAMTPLELNTTTPKYLINVCSKLAGR